MKVKFKKLVSYAIAPEKKTEGAAGFDLCASEDVTVRNINVTDSATMIPTGIAVELPPGYHAKMFLRSSTGLKTKLRLANGTGIIDSDYRGEIKILAETNGRAPVIVNRGDRLVQLIIEKDLDVVFEEVKELSETKRGSDGFGSTNKRRKSNQSTNREESNLPTNRERKDD